MDKYLIRATVDGSEHSELMMASSEREAVIMFKTHMKWIHPTKNIEIIETEKKTNTEIKRLNGNWPE